MAGPFHWLSHVRPFVRPVSPPFDGYAERREVAADRAGIFVSSVALNGVCTGRPDRRRRRGGGRRICKQSEQTYARGAKCLTTRPGAMRSWRIKDAINGTIFNKTYTRTVYKRPTRHAADPGQYLPRGSQVVMRTERQCTRFQLADRSVRLARPFDSQRNASILAMNRPGGQASRTHVHC